MGLYAAETAFSGQCDGWLNELRRYLTANRDFLVEYVTENMPDVRLTIPDATYLGWLDFTQTKINGSPYEFFLKNAKVALSEGTDIWQGRRGTCPLELWHIPQTAHAGTGSNAEGAQVVIRMRP